MDFRELIKVWIFIRKNIEDNTWQLSLKDIYSFFFLFFPLFLLLHTKVEFIIILQNLGYCFYIMWNNNIIIVAGKNNSISLVNTK